MPHVQTYQSREIRVIGDNNVILSKTIPAETYTAFVLERKQYIPAVFLTNLIEFRLNLTAITA